MVGLAWGCEPAPEVTTLPLGLRQVAACRIGALESLEISALGDFPTQRASLSVSAPSTAFERLPEGTRELGVRVQSASGPAFGRYVFGAAERAGSVLLLPDARSCTLIDDDRHRARAGAAIAALPSGGVLIAGGSDERNFALTTAAVWIPPDEIGETVGDDGMLLRRTYASATPWDGGVVVAGGLGEMRGNAHETFEVFEEVSRRFVRSGRLRAPRMEHGAIALADGRLLLAGGRAEFEGEPLASAELLDVSKRAGELLQGEQGLRVARARPSLLRLDSGSVLVAAGQARDGSSLGSIERYDVIGRRFQLLADDLPVREELAVAALPGARLVWLTCDSRPGDCELHLLFEREASFEREQLQVAFADEAPEGLSQLQLLPLRGAELLLTAADDSDPNLNRRAFVIDLVSGSLTKVDATRVPHALLRLRDGVISELDDAGISLRAAELLGRYDSPSGNLLYSRYLELDSPKRWQREHDALRAERDGARLDLAPLRFGDARVQLELEGDAELLWYADEGGAHVSLRVSRSELSLGACSRQLQAGAVFSLTRRAEQLSISERGGAGCNALVPTGPAGLGLRASAGTLVRLLSVQRL